MPLADLVQFLGLARKTGVLRVETPHGRKRLVMENGLAVFCSSDNPKEYLGQHLLARTDLTEADLETAFRVQRESGLKLGEVLVSHGFLQADELERVLHYKVEDSMFELFTWQSGTFEFSESSLADEDLPLKLGLGWQDLVMEGARRSDEMARIREAIPGPHVRLVTKRECFKPGFPRTGGDHRLIELVEQGLSVSEILPRFHSSDFEILSRLAALVREGMLDVDASAPTPPAQPCAGDVVRQATELMNEQRSPEAWTLLKDATQRFFDDPAVSSALAVCEARLRRRFDATFGDRSASVALKVPLEQLMGMPLDSKEAFLATRITGTWPLQSVVQLCPFDELEVLCLVENLMRKGLVELRSPVRA